MDGSGISLQEWAVGIPSVLNAGKATFTITNKGTTPHELLVFQSDLDPTAYPRNPAGGIDEEGAGVVLLSDGENIDPGGSQKRKVALTPGKYLFVCNIPGHFQQHMYTAVTVVDKSNTSPQPSGAQAAGSIALKEWAVSTASTLNAGRTTFTISNAGTTPHELLVFQSDLNPASYPKNPAGGIDEEGAGIVLLSDGENIDPGGQQSRVVDLTPGKYLFVCNIPGHFQQGMYTIVTVT